MTSNGTLHISSRKPTPSCPKILLSIEQSLVVVVHASFLLVVLFFAIELILLLRTESRWDSQDIWFSSYTASEQDENGLCTMKQFTLTTSLLEEHREAEKRILVHCNEGWRTPWSVERDYLGIFGNDRVAALRLIGPLRGSRTRLSIGILLNDSEKRPLWKPGGEEFLLVQFSIGQLSIAFGLRMFDRLRTFFHQRNSI